MTKSENTNLDPSQIEAALAAGIISPAQAEIMRKAGSDDGPDQGAAVFGNEDEMRFIRGFSDIFIGIGLILLTLGIWVLTGVLGGGMLYFAAAATLWAASEYFGNKKRAHLPTLILALAFLFFIQKASAAILPSQISGLGIGAALITLLAMLVYYLRFRLPFCIALITLSALGLGYSLIGNIAPRILQGGTGWVMILGGIITFVIAMFYDMKDTDRLTRFSDNAFWLHLTAAPLIVHGIALLALVKTTRMEFGFLPLSSLDKPDAILVLLAVAVLSLIGLAINRRALIASSLGYAAIALIYLASGTGLGFTGIAALVLLIMGSAIILLGIGWHSARRVLLNALPRSGVFGKIFPPETYVQNKAKR